VSGEVRPGDRAALAAALREATLDRRTVRVAGGGSSSRRGLPGPAADVVLRTGALDRVLVHEPADLTVTVEAGADAAALQARLAGAGQTWAQADDRGGATVGGLLATGASGIRRLRHGALRDSVLEMVLCTGDGRLVRAGGRTVKGVAGFDLHRLAVGALGTLGVIVEVTLKLWPLPTAAAWFGTGGTTAELAALGEELRRRLHRPAAIVLGPGRLDVQLVGPEADVVAPEGLGAGERPPPPPGEGTVEAAVPPTALPSLARALDDLGLPFRAQLGVGVCAVGVRSADEVAAVRAAAIHRGGHAVVADAPAGLRADPWGPAPPGLAVMRRLRASFDPAGILNPGAFVGDAVPVASV